MKTTTDIRTLDASGLHCPLPVLKAKNALAAMTAGERIEVLATDPASVRDFAAFTRKHGHCLLDQSESSGQYRFLIEKNTSEARRFATHRGHLGEQRLDG